MWKSCHRRIEKDWAGSWQIFDKSLATTPNAVAKSLAQKQIETLFLAFYQRLPTKSEAASLDDLRPEFGITKNTRQWAQALCHTIASNQEQIIF